MNKKKILFILNPIAGKRHKENLSKSIREHLDHSRFDDDIVVTDYAGHAVTLAQEAVAQQYDIVAVAGGDGSINEVGSCLIGTNIALAVLPHVMTPTRNKMKMPEITIATFFMDNQPILCV